MGWEALCLDNWGGVKSCPRLCWFSITFASRSSKVTYVGGTPSLTLSGHSGDRGYFSGDLSDGVPAAWAGIVPSGLSLPPWDCYQGTQGQKPLAIELRADKDCLLHQTPRRVP